MTAKVLRILAKLPLSVLHRAGALLGWLVFLVSPGYARRLRANIAGSGIYADPGELERATRSSVAEIGKGAAELVKVWFGDTDELARLVECSTWHVVEEAQALGRGTIILTPHLGCFEIAGWYVAQRIPITILYRPPKQSWIEPLMIAGRSRGHAEVAPANMRGVRLLYRALKRGAAVGVLPDQTPQIGEGAWAPFFGREAYTITLVSRLEKQTGATILFARAERLPRGRGYALAFERYTGALFDERAMNGEIERLIRECPTQYLWSYNRYKIPKGVDAPTAAGEST